MPPKEKFLAAEFSKRWDESYQKLTNDQQEGVDKVVLALMKQKPTPGMRVKPIQPEKYYDEARINSGDRLVHRVEGGVVWYVDIVKHDDIKKYGKRIEGLFP